MRPTSESAEWIFLATSLGLEMLSAACDQASSPRRPHFALFGMLLAFAAVFISIGELIYRGKRERVGTLPDIYGLVAGISQCICSIVQYVYCLRHGDSPLKASLLPAIFLICLVGARLSNNRMNASTEETLLHPNSGNNAPANTPSPDNQEVEEQERERQVRQRQVPLSQERRVRQQDLWQREQEQERLQLWLLEQERLQEQEQEQERLQLREQERLQKQEQERLRLRLREREQLQPQPQEREVREVPQEQEQEQEQERQPEQEQEQLRLWLREHERLPMSLQERMRLWLREEERLQEQRQERLRQKRERDSSHEGKIVNVKY